MWSGPILDEQAGFVRKRADENHDEIDQVADAEEAGGEQPDDAGPDLSDVKSVYPEISEKKAQ
jgi:hypothetical protein